MAVYQQYGTGTETESKKKKRDDDGVDVVGTKNTNTNTNTNTIRISSVVALMSTLVAVVLMVIVMYVQASLASLASLSSTAAFEDANLLRSGTGTNTVIIDDSAAAGVVAATPLPPKIGALLSSFILSDKCVDRFHTYQQDVQWKSACMCLFGDRFRSGFDEYNACKNDNEHGCPILAAERFASCDKDEEEFDDYEFETCLNNLNHKLRLQSITNLVDSVLHHKSYLVCFRSYPPSSSYP